MRYIFTPRALLNIAQIAHYLRERNPQVAPRVRAEIYESIQLLVLFPNMGRPQNTRGVRKLVIQKYPYLLYYRFDETNKLITILNVKHHTQQRPYDDAE